MFEVAKNAWKIVDLRKKIVYTIFIILLFRLGSVIPVPFVSAEVMKTIFSGSEIGGGMMGYLNTLAGGALEKASIFAMSISPYINASIIIQLLTVAIPPLERMQKEGEEGQKKIQQIVRCITIALGLIQAYGFYTILRYSNALENETWFPMIVIVLSFTAGTALIMWLGEQINEKGIGNGISIILFASIVSRAPSVIQFAVGQIDLGRWWLVIIFFAIAATMITAIVFMNDSERRIPVQYAKKVVGRKMYGGQSTHLPLKVTMTGVLPIIFAGSFVSMPSLIAGFFPKSDFANFIEKHFGYTSIPYGIIYFILIIAFNFFYIAIQYNPIEIANNIKKNGGFIPGIRPGKPSSDFIKKVLNKITLIGALFLACIAVLPIVFSAVSKMNIALAGTSILIVVGVILETLKQLESQMLMRHYKGFLE